MNNKIIKRFKKIRSRMIKKGHAIWPTAVMIWCITVAPAAAETPPTITLQKGLKIVTSENRSVKIAKLSEAIAESEAHYARASLLLSINASAARTNMAHQPAMSTAWYKLEPEQ
jgi:hypothetical protein